MIPGRCLLLSCGLLLSLCAPAAAQITYTWNGGGSDGNWSTPANWGGTRPVSSPTDTVISLAGTTNTATTIDTFYGSTLQVRGLTFQNAAGPFTVASAGPVLEVSLGGIAANGGAVTQVISAPVRLAADQTWSAVGPSVLRVTGPIDLGNYTLATTVTGAGSVELAGTISGTGQLAPHRVVLSGTNTYSGGTVVDAGAFVQTATAAGLGTGLVDLKGNSTIAVTAAGDATLPGGLWVTNTGANDINRLQINNDLATVRLPAGGLAGSGTLSREGTGTLVLTGANPFSGTLYTGTGGRLELVATEGATSLNANSYNIFATTFHVGPGALLLNNRPVIVDAGGRVEFEQSQSLSGIAVGNSTVNNNNAIIAPNVTLTVSGYVTGTSGTLTANITGFLTSGFVKSSTGTLVMSGNSDFVGQTRIDAGVLSIDSIANGGSASAIGASSELITGSAATLRYTGSSASTDRTLTVNGTVSGQTNTPSTVEVSNAATVLTWNGPVNIGSGHGFVKAGPGTLVLAGRSATSLGTATVSGGTLVVTATGGLTTATTVQSGATISGKLTAPGANLNDSGQVTVQTGATLRAGTGGSSDRFGVNSAIFQSGTTFVVTVDGGATPTSSRLTTEGGSPATVNFATDPAHPITLRIEKGTGADFAGSGPVTLEIVHTNQLTGTFNFPNTIKRQGGSFTYVPSEWNIQTVGFSVVPGSISLVTDANNTVLSVQFTPVPEPVAVLGVAGAGWLAFAAGRRLVRRRTEPQPA